MSDQANTNGQKSVFSRVMGCILRLIFVIVAGLALGAGVYFGAAALYGNYVRSVRVNTQQISDLNARLQTAEQHSQSQTGDLAARLQALEDAGNRQKTALDQLQARLDGLEATSQAQSEVQTSLQSLQADLETLQKDARALQTQVSDLSQAVSTGYPRFQALETQINDKTAEISDLEQQIQTFKIVELLTRSRYNLVQNNLGRAYQDIQAAGALAQELQSRLPADQAQTAENVSIYLQSALENLPQKPVAAADAVDSAWGLLVQGPVSATPQPLPFPAEPLLTPPAGGTLTPTPTPAQIPTSTPIAASHF